MARPCPSTSRRASRRSRSSHGCRWSSSCIPRCKATTLKELIALARANPGTPHLRIRRQRLAAAPGRRTVPAPGQRAHAPRALQGQRPGDGGPRGRPGADMIETAPAAQPHIKAGKLRALATATREPVPTLPDVPTAADAGLEGFEVSSMFGVVAPAGTPGGGHGQAEQRAQVDHAHAGGQESLLEQGALAGWTTVEDSQAAIRDESNKWKRLIKEASIQVE